MGPRKTALVLWDIDHTLVETRGVGTQLFLAAFERVTGKPINRVVRAHGHTEPDVFADTARACGVEPSAELFARFANELATLHWREIDWLRRQGRPLPGAAAALELLAKEAGIAQSVVTGNVRGVAAAKLHAYRLGGWLDGDIGGYGSDDRDRARLVDIARGRAGIRHGVVFAGRATVVIGDTAADITAARSAGAAVIAVASGYSTLDVLQAGRPDVALAELPGPMALLEHIVDLVGTAC
jgi:phosphoglycolate phosphatase-like HAD superfamily hydrolase